MPDSYGELPPRLMVPVRDFVEWDLALANEVDIVDLPWIKGTGETAVPWEDWTAGLSSLCPPGLGISIDCGELTEISGMTGDPQIPQFVRWARLGFAGLGCDVAWKETWCAIRSRLDADRTRPISWWAVAYADHNIALSPHPQEILQAAVETRASGFMLDTFVSSGPNLVDWMSPQELTDLLRQARELQMPVILGGETTSEDLEWLCDLEPDVIAVRNCVCRYGDATEPLSPTRLEWYRQTLDASVEFDRAGWKASRALQFASSNS